ncbi:MAG: DUF2786 domain-containing protein [Deltaproteobacteria bacterium]|nr:DUF2786 domain-containing protein [Deltaproteobacteria bacterium]
MSDDEKILQRVRDLLRLAHGNENVHEAAAAAARAQALMTRHQISEAEVRASGIVDVEDVGKLVLDERGQVTHWRGRIAAGVADANGCYACWEVVREIRRGRFRQTGVALQMYGKPSAVDASKHLYLALVRMCDADTRAAMKGAGRSATHAYRLGWATAVADRLVDEALRIRSEHAGTAIVKVPDCDLAREAAEADNGGTIGSTNTPGHSDRDAFRKGLADGSEARLGDAPRVGSGTPAMTAGG